MWGLSVGVEARGKFLIQLSLSEMQFIAISESIQDLVSSVIRVVDTVSTASARAGADESAKTKQQKSSYEIPVFPGSSRRTQVNFRYFRIPIMRLCTDFIGEVLKRAHMRMKLEMSTRNSHDASIYMWATHGEISAPRKFAL